MFMQNFSRVRLDGYFFISKVPLGTMAKRFRILLLTSSLMHKIISFFSLFLTISTTSCIEEYNPFSLLSNNPSSSIIMISDDNELLITLFPKSKDFWEKTNLPIFSPIRSPTLKNSQRWPVSKSKKNLFSWPWVINPKTLKFSFKTSDRLYKKVDLPVPFFPVMTKNSFFHRLLLRRHYL